MYLPSPFTSLPQHSEDRRRLGINLKQVCFFYSRLSLLCRSTAKIGGGSAKISNKFGFLLSSFTSLPHRSEDRMRLGKNLKQVWLFALAFHFFAASQRR